MKKVSFTEMKYGTKDDYQLLEKLESQYERKTADRVLKYLASQTTTLEGYQVTRLEHALQAATTISSLSPFLNALVAVCNECSSLET